MIIDRNWNKKEQTLTISYVDKLGNRQFYKKYLHFQLIEYLYVDYHIDEKFF